MKFMTPGPLLEAMKWRIGMDVLKVCHPDNFSRFIKISPPLGKTKAIEFDRLSILSGEAISPNCYVKILTALSFVGSAD
jgi:hypothetical protein